MSDVFVSYSRQDKDFVGGLRDALLVNNQEVWIDWESIPPSQTWWDEIKKGIERANNVVVVLSPNSMASPICHLEIEYARQLNKRIIPVLYEEYERESSLAAINERIQKKEEFTTREIWGTRNPSAVYDANDGDMKHINYFFFSAEDDFSQKFTELLEVINTDYEHKEHHTTLSLRAQEWNRRERNPSFLLIDDELAQAQAWFVVGAGKQPPVTQLQKDYIEASEKRTRQLRNIRRASFIGSSIAVIALVFAIGATLIGIQANQNANDAIERENQANTKVADANENLTAIPPTLTDINQQVFNAVTAESEARTGQETAQAQQIIAQNEQATAQAGQETAQAQQIIAQNEQATAQVAQATSEALQVIAENEQETAQARQVIAQDAQATAQAGQATSEALQATAEFARAEARTEAEALFYAGESQNILNAENGDMELAALLAIHSLDTAYNSLADRSLMQALNRITHSQTFNTHQGIINEIEIIDNRWILSGGSDNFIIITDLQGIEITRFINTGEYIRTLTASPDGQRIFTAHESGIVRSWDFATGEELLSYIGHTEPTVSISHHPTRNLFATASFDENVYIWNSDTGEILASAIGENTVLYSADGNQLLIANSFVGYLVNFSEETTYTLRGHNGFIQNAAFNADGTQIVTASTDNTLILWDTANGEAIRSFEGHTGSVSDVAFINDGRQIVSSSWDYTLRIWDVETGETLNILSGHSSMVDALAVTDNNQIISGSFDTTFRVWESEPIDPQRVLRADKDMITDVVYSPDGELFVSVGMEDIIRVWASEGNQLLQEIKDGNVKGLMAVDYHPTASQIVTAGFDSDFRVYDIETGEALAEFDTGTTINDVVFHPDGTLIASAGNNQVVQIWDVDTQELIFQFEVQDIAQSVEFTPDGQSLVGGIADGTIIRWNIETGEEEWQTQITGVVSKLVFTPDGNTLYTGDWGGAITVIDAQTGEFLEEWQRHTNAVYGLDLSPDTALLASSAADGTVRLWDTATGEQLRVLEGHISEVHGVAFSPDGEKLLASTGTFQAPESKITAEIRIWDVDYLDFIAYACTRIERHLTTREKTVYQVENNEPICERYISSDSPAMTIPPSDGEVIFSDDFDDNAAGWEEDESEDTSVILDSEQLILTLGRTTQFVTMPGITDWSLAPQVTAPFELQVDVTITVDTGIYGVGFLFGGQEGYEGSNYVWFTESGNYNVQELFSINHGGGQLIQNVVIDDGEPHTMRLQVYPSQLLLLVDDILIANIPHDTHIEGAVGLHFGTGSFDEDFSGQAIFDNFIVRDLSP